MFDDRFVGSVGCFFRNYQASEQLESQLVAEQKQERKLQSRANTGERTKPVPRNLRMIEAEGSLSAESTAPKTVKRTK
jgi:hypothetical protein